MPILDHLQIQDIHVLNSVLTIDHSLSNTRRTIQKSKKKITIQKSNVNKTKQNQQVFVLAFCVDSVILFIFKRFHNCCSWYQSFLLFSVELLSKCFEISEKFELFSSVIR